MLSPSRIDENELNRAGSRVLDGTRTEKFIEAVDSAASVLAATVNYMSQPMRNAIVDGVLDPVLDSKARRCLNWLIDSSYYPEFDDDNNTAGTEALSESTVDPPSIDPDPARVPPRMFDLDTGNLEEGLNANNVGMYCILSHCWKGCEIDYSYVSKVKERDRKREKYEGMLAAGPEILNPIAQFAAKKYSYLDNSGNQNPIGSDVQRLEAQCDEDIKLQIQKINGVNQRLRALESDNQHDNVRILLRMFAEHKRNGWENKDDAFFNKFKPLRSVVEEMFLLMQQRKSADKIKNSISSAKEILDRRIFPYSEKRYLWIDTCCINKAIIGEHVDTLARMGEWYTNAEFCLVHLDSGKTDKEWDKWEEWVKEWDRWVANQSKISISLTAMKPPSVEKPNFASFDEIRNPSWATRGWTLQELVLSKISFYINDLWKPLHRPIENLGRYYYLCSFLDEYISSNLDSDDGAEENPRTNDDHHDPNMNRALHLISILNFLGIEFPNDIDDVTAKAQISKSVDQASEQLEIQLCGRSTRDSRITSPGLQYDASGLKSRIIGSIDKAAEGLIGNWQKGNTPYSEQTHQRENLVQNLGFISPQSLTKTTIKFLIDTLIEDLVTMTKDAIKKDKQLIGDFSNIPASESCRGSRRSKLSAFEVMHRASRRECTVQTDQAYSLMGILGVKFAAFHAEGLTKALSRLIDEIVIASNDISVFNWSGSNLGSPIKGRSLYPSNLHAFTKKESIENGYKRASKDIHFLADAYSNAYAILRRIIKHIKDNKEEDKAAKAMQLILDVIKKTDLSKLEPRFEILRKTLKCAEDVVNDRDQKTAKTTDAVRRRSPFRRPRLSFIMRKGTRDNLDVPSNHEEAISSQTSSSINTADTIPGMRREPPESPIVTRETMESELDFLISYLNDHPDCSEEIPGNVKVVLEEIGESKPEAFTEPPKLPARPKSSPNKSMVSPNPIIVNTSGIEAVFDIQRTVITMENPGKLWSQVRNAANPNQKIGGRCTISTGLAATTVSFSCGRDILKKQLHVSDVIERIVLNVKINNLETLKKRRPNSDSETLKKTRSHSDSLTIETDSSSDDATLKPNITPDDDRKSLEMPTDAESENVNPPLVVGDDKQRRVSRMLEFVQESNINVVAGEWVLMRFSGVPDAKWFLCLLELGSTHNFYGYRISTDDIDFQNASPEEGLIEHWEAYLTKKRDELCTIAELLFRKKRLHGYQQKVHDEIVKDDSKTTKVSFSYTIKKLKAELMAGFLTAYARHKDLVLSDNILRAMPKHLRAAILNLDENADMLPAVFFSAIKVHMF